MQNFGVNGHISEQFNLELSKLRQLVLKLGGEIEYQLTGSILQLVDKNKLVAENDFKEKVEILLQQIDKDCTSIIIKRQPAARDLHLVMLLYKAANDLKYIAMSQVEINKLIYFLSKDTAIDYQDLIKLLNHTKDMLHFVLDAFARMDKDAAANLYKLTATIDVLQKKYLIDLQIKIIEQPSEDLLKEIELCQKIYIYSEQIQILLEYILLFK